MRKWMRKKTEADIWFQSKYIEARRCFNDSLYTINHRNRIKIKVKNGEKKKITDRPHWIEKKEVNGQDSKPLLSETIVKRKPKANTHTHTHISSQLDLRTSMLCQMTDINTVRVAELISLWGMKNTNFMWNEKKNESFC